MYIENIIKATVCRKCGIDAPADLVTAVNNKLYEHFAKGAFMTGPSDISEKIYESSGNDVVANTDWSSILAVYKSDGVEKAAEKVLTDRQNAYHQSKEYMLYKKSIEKKMHIDYATSLIIRNELCLDARVIELVAEKAEDMSYDEIDAYNWKLEIEKVESEDEDDDCYDE